MWPRPSLWPSDYVFMKFSDLLCAVERLHRGFGDGATGLHRAPVRRPGRHRGTFSISDVLLQRAAPADPREERGEGERGERRDLQCASALGLSFFVGLPSSTQTC